MVLAAGLGTRLRPLTDRVAKPLVPVGDRPALAHVLDRLRAAEAPRLVVNAHHHAAQLRAFAAAHRDLAVSEEPALLGTAGGVAHARALLGKGDALLWNGDILADLDARALVAAHRAAATLVVQPMAKGQGSVGLDGRGRVVRLRRDRFGEEVSGGEFLGIYVVSEALRARMPEPGGMVEDVLVPALARGEPVDAFFFDGPWHDIGTLASYLTANLAWLVAREAGAWVAVGADVAPGVALDEAIVGEGARVEGTGTLRRCVVWPGARAVAPLEGAIVTPDGVVPA
jgi:mannose-1-phosphate guanylyltransferase